MIEEVKCSVHLHFNIAFLKILLFVDVREDELYNGIKHNFNTCFELCFLIVKQKLLPLRVINVEKPFCDTNYILAILYRQKRNYECFNDSTKILKTLNLMI